MDNQENKLIKLEISELDLQCFIKDICHFQENEFYFFYKTDSLFINKDLNPQFYRMYWTGFLFTLLRTRDQIGAIFEYFKDNEFFYLFWPYVQKVEICTPNLIIYDFKVPNYRFFWDEERRAIVIKQNVISVVFSMNSSFKENRENVDLFLGSLIMCEKEAKPINYYVPLSDVLREKYIIPLLCNFDIKE